MQIFIVFQLKHMIAIPLRIIAPEQVLMVNTGHK